MGEIYIWDKSKADTLLSRGFIYNIKEIDGREVFVFMPTKNLIRELKSNFEEGSFFINKTVNF